MEFAYGCVQCNAVVLLDRVNMRIKSFTGMSLGFG